MLVKLSLVLLAGVLMPSAAWTQDSGAPAGAARTISFFPFHSQWHGADDAYSIPLSGDRFLWLFGDTFVGRKDKQRMAGDVMPRNSIGIADCAAGQRCRVEYFWTRHKDGPPSAFFDTGTNQWYWPLDGFVSNGTLYVFLVRMRSRQGDGGAFDFAYSGEVLASVKNFMDRPELWKVVYKPVLDGDAVIPGVAAAMPSVIESRPGKGTEPGFAYVLAWVKDGDRPEMALLRLPESSLNDPAVSAGWWQYLADNDTWHAWTTEGSLPADAKVMVRGNFTEATVKYHPELHQWLMTMPGDLYQGVGMSSHADSLTGPWSAPAPFYRYPEMQAGNRDHTPNVFCYADKEHPELESTGYFTFTYACNSMKVAEVMAHNRLYHPIVVTIPIANVVGAATK